MISPLLALRQGIVSRLSSDTLLISGLLNGVHIYDRVPSALEGLYMTFGDAFAEDQSLHSTERSHEIKFSLIVWSTPAEGLREERGRHYGNSKRALQVASRLIELLDHAPLTLIDYQLIFMRYVSEKLTRDIASGSARVEVSFQAMVEYQK
jgi:hypothetical protein